MYIKDSIERVLDYLKCHDCSLVFRYIPKGDNNRIVATECCALVDIIPTTLNESESLLCDIPLLASKMDIPYSKYLTTIYNLDDYVSIVSSGNIFDNLNPGVGYRGVILRGVDNDYTCDCDFYAHWSEVSKHLRKFQEDQCFYKSASSDLKVWNTLGRILDHYHFDLDVIRNKTMQEIIDDVMNKRK